jgi:uncharacterized membrane protein
MRELWQHERLFLKFPPHYFNDDGGLLKQPSSQSWCSRTFSPANMRQMMCEEFAHGASHLSDFGIPFLSNSRPGVALFCRLAYGPSRSLGRNVSSYRVRPLGKRRADLIRMVPESVGNPGVWVTLTGIAEIAIAVGLQIYSVAPWVAAIAVVMLCCLFPANSKAARENLTILRKPVLSAGPRLLIQLVFIAALIASVWPRR